ncbi:MAG: hypothetical protein CMI63_08215 [Parvularcula sp.]|nr:hypothetical protein [Parvularcula sp.]
MLRSMMKNPIDIADTNADGPRPTDEEDRSWEALAARIQKLAFRRSRSLMAEAFDEDFDRGARSLRLLMGAAEISNRMKREEEKEQQSHDRRASGQGLTEADIEATYRKIFNTVERVEREDAGTGSGNAAQGDGADAPSGSGGGAKAVAGERS